MPGITLNEVLEKYRDQITAIKSVAGVGEGECNGQPCIRVFVLKKSPQVLKEIPAILEGYAVCVEETGEFKALGSSIDQGI